MPWVGLVALAALVADAPRARLGALFGFCFGAGANLVALRFVPEVIARFTPLPWMAGLLALVLLSAAQGLSWALAGAGATVLRQRGLPRFVAFGLAVYFSLFLPGIFPWTPAGGVTPWPALVQSADTIGERGVSLLIALTSGLLVDGALAWRRQGRRAAMAPWLVGLAIPLASGLWGAQRMRRIDAERSLARKAKIALLQPSIAAAVRWEPSRAPEIHATLTRLTRSAEARGAELTVWPESAFPYALLHTSRRSPVGERALLGFGVRGPVLAGVYMTKDPSSATNSALVAGADGALSAPYDKRHLLLFGEAVPFAEDIPWLKKTFARGTGLVPGKSNVVLRAGPVRAGVLVCYEDNLPEAGREAMSTGAPNLLVNLTNDAWFTGSHEGELHLRLAVLRAVEARRDLVRSVNLGPTSFVDAAGRVLARYDAPFPQALLVEAALLETPGTFYVRFGDAPLAALAVAAALFHALRARNEKRRDR